MRSMKRDYKSEKLILQESGKIELDQNELSWFFAEIERNTIQEHIPKIRGAFQKEYPIPCKLVTLQRSTMKPGEIKIFVSAYAVEISSR